MQRSLHRATDATFVPKYAKEDMIRSGHLHYDTLYASNEQQVNILTTCGMILACLIQSKYLIMCKKYK